MENRPYPGDHPVHNTEIVPAAVLLDTFLSCAFNAGGTLTDLRLRTPVAPARARDIQVVLQDRSLRLSSRLIDDDGQDASDDSWLTHSSAVVAIDDETVELPGGSVGADTWQRCSEELPPGHVVDTLAGVGVAAMRFGWQILALRRGEGELIARVSAEPDGSMPSTWAGLLDAATSAASTVFDGPPRLRMPARIDRVHVCGVPPAVAVLHVRHREGTTTDVSIADESDAVLASITAMTFEELENPAGSDTSRMLHHVAWHSTPWHSTPWQPDSRPTQVVVVGGADDELGPLECDLAAAGVPSHRCAGSDQLPDHQPRGSVVLLLPPAVNTPEAAAELVLRTLNHLNDKGSQARLWVLTRGVHEGADLVHAPLWGMARVAAAEHPQLRGGVLDVADGAFPVGALASLHGHGVVVVRDSVALTARSRLTAAPPPRGIPMRARRAGRI